MLYHWLRGPGGAASDLEDALRMPDGAVRRRPESARWRRAVNIIVECK